MPTATVNFAKPKPKPVETPPDVIPPGEYIVTIVGCDQKTSLRQRRLYWVWKFSVSGAHKDFRLHYVTLLDGLKDRLAQLYEVATGNKAKGVVTINSDGLIGLSMVAVVEQRNFREKAYNEIVELKKAVK